MEGAKQTDMAKRDVWLALSRMEDAGDAGDPVSRLVTYSMHPWHLFHCDILNL